MEPRPDRMDPPSRSIRHLRNRRLSALALAWLAAGAVLGFRAGYTRSVDYVAPFPGVTQPASAPPRALR